MVYPPISWKRRRVRANVSGSRDQGLGWGEESFGLRQLFEVDHSDGYHSEGMEWPCS
jgi:hypothetical protein